MMLNLIDRKNVRFMYKNTNFDYTFGIRDLKNSHLYTLNWSKIICCGKIGYVGVMSSILDPLFWNLGFQHYSQ